MLPADQRLKSFGTGDLEIDPVNVGYVTTKIPGGFTIDTGKPGNSNSGHEFRNAPAGTKGVIGPELTDDQRWQLVEYLKVINEFPDAMKAAAALPPPTGPCWTPQEPYVCKFPPTPSPAH
jgi:hypothetical protein